MKKVKIALAIIFPLLLIAGGGWYYLVNLPPDLEIKEGMTKLQLHHIKNGTAVGNTTTTYAVTQVNTNSKLELGMSSYRMDRGGGSEDVFLNIYVIGNFSDDIHINTLKIFAKGNAYTNDVDFSIGGSKERGANMWSSDRIVPGASGNSTCFLGYDVYSHNFQASTEIFWEIWSPKNESTYILTVTAVAYVSSEKIPVTLNVIVEGERNYGS